MKQVPMVSLVVLSLSVFCPFLLQHADESARFTPPRQVPFVDDFTRPGLQANPWQYQSGDWRVKHVVQRMDITNFGTIFDRFRGNWKRLRERGLPEWSQRAANLSRLQGRNGLAVTGLPSWENYQFAVSAMSLYGAVGLVFGLQENGDHYSVGWDLASVSPRAARFWLRRTWGGESREIASGYLKGASRQWYRLQASALNTSDTQSRIVVSLDGAKVFDVFESRPVRGRAGLLTRGKASYDDVEILPVSSWAFDSDTAIRSLAGKREGNWRLDARPAALKAAPRRVGASPVDFLADSAEWCTFGLANPLKNSTCASAQVEFTGEAKDVGFQVSDERGRQLSFHVREAGGKVEFTLVREGQAKEQILAGEPASVRPAVWHRVEFVARLGQVKAYIDGELELKARAEFGNIRRLALFSLESPGTRFSSPALLAKRPEDWERQPKNHWYVIDPFMQHWANPAGYWVSAHSGHTTVVAQNELWHKSDFFGAHRITIPFRPESGIIFSANDPHSGERYTAEVLPVPDLVAESEKPEQEKPAPPAFDASKYSQYRLRLSRNGKPVGEVALLSPKAIIPPKAKMKDGLLRIPVLDNGRVVMDEPLEQETFRLMLPKLMTNGCKKIELVQMPGTTDEVLAAVLDICRQAGCGELTIAGPPEPSVEPTPAGLAFDRPVKEFTAHREGRYVWVSIDGQKLIEFRDPHPLPGRRAGVFSESGIEPSAITVARNHVKDYLFEKATSDWNRIGNWETWNRFDCDPRWIHLVTMTDSSSALWNKYDFRGDYTLEYYIGNRMHATSLGWYARPGDYNATIAGDGLHPDVGYTIRVGAWDRDWTGRRTELLRNGQRVAMTDRPLVPSSRPRPPVRPIRVPIIARGRDTHGAWYQIKIRRIGSRLQLWYDNELALEYNDPEPLEGRKIGLWTMDNYVVLARVQVSYEHAEVPRLEFEDKTAPAPASPRPEGPGLLVRSATHPGIVSDFESGPQGWRANPGNRTQFEVQGPDKVRPSRYLQVTNVFPGGALAAYAPVTKEMDLTRVRHFSFDYRIQPGTRINLYLKTLGRRHLVQLTGEEDATGHALTIYKVKDAKDDGQWRHAEVPLDECLLAIYPSASSLPLEELAFGNLNEGYQKAGFAGALHPGDAYALDNFSMVSVGKGEVALSMQPNSPGAWEFSTALDHKPDTLPGEKNLTEEREARFSGLASGLWYFHVKARKEGEKWSGPVHYAFEVDARPFGVTEIRPRPGGVLQPGEPIHILFGPGTVGAPDVGRYGIWLNDQRLPNNGCYEYDRRSRTLRIDPRQAGIFLSNGQTLRVKILELDKDGRFIRDWHVIGPFNNAGDTGFDRETEVEKKVELSKTCLGLDQRPVKWQKVEAAEKDGLIDLVKVYEKNTNVFAYGYAELNFDAPQASTKLGIGSDDGVKVWLNGKLIHSNHVARGYVPEQDKLDVKFRKGKNALLVKVTQGIGGWSFGVKVREWKAVKAFQYQVNLSSDSVPPTRVELVPSRSLPSGYPLSEGFEYGLGAFHRGGGKAVIDTASAASGMGSLRLEVDRPAAPVMIVAGTAEFSLGHYPLLAFDYRLVKSVYLNLGLSIGGRTRGVQISDPEPGLSLLATVPDVQPGKEWHHVEINLWEALAREDAIDPKKLASRTLRIGDFGYRANLPGGECSFDNIQLVPVVRSTSGLLLNWSARDEGGVAGYSYAWSDRPDAKLDHVIDTTKTNVTIRDLPEGTHFLKVAAADVSGNWGPVSSYRFTVDNTPPEIGEPRGFGIDGKPSRSSATTYRIPLSDNAAGIDFSQLRLYVKGKRVQDPLEQIRYDADHRELVWDWCRDQDAFSRRLRRGGTVRFALKGLRDFAGNEAPSRTWSIRIDKKRDRIPPLAPELGADHSGLLVHDTFGRGKGRWGADSSGSPVEVVAAYDPGRKDLALSVTVTEHQDHWAINPRTPAFSARQFPYVFFEYRLPEDAHLQLLAVVDRKYYSVSITGRSKDYVTIGAVRGATADGRWHTALINLADMVVKELELEPGASLPKMQVTQLLLGNWDARGTDQGKTVSIDNFSIAGTGSEEVRFENGDTRAIERQSSLTFHAWDLTGIDALLSRVDREPGTVPDPAKPAKEHPRLTPGVWYLHVRARDGAGNWSATTHVPLYVPTGR